MTQYLGGFKVTDDGALVVSPAAGGSFANPTFTGVALFADGTSAAPSIAFTNATDSGFFRQAGATGVVVTSGGVDIGMFRNTAGLNLSATSALGWTSGLSQTTATDVSIGRLAAGSAGATVGRWSVKQGAAVASATQVTLGSDGNRFQVTGTTQTDLILSTGWQGGSIVTLHFQGIVTCRHNQAPSGAFHPLMLAGAASFVSSADDQLTLQYDSTASKWYEIGRTVI
jgi:hypothetical protein